MVRRMSVLATMLAMGLIAGCSGSGGSTAATSGAGASSSGASTTSGSSRPVGPSVSASTSVAVGPITADSAVASIIAASEAALRASSTFAFVAKSTQSGQTSETSLRVDSTGGCVGSVTTARGVISLRIKNAQVYIKAPDDFWSSQLSLAAAAVAQVSGKWVQAPVTDGSFSSFATASTVSGISDQLFSGVSTSALTKTAVTQIAGKRAIGLNDASGSVLYVSLDGAPLPLAVIPDPTVAQTTGATGGVTLSNFDEPFTVDLPDATQIVAWSAVPH
jgi:hypothetical protein